MRSRYYAREKERAYFITSTIVNWLPVFAVPARDVESIAAYTDGRVGSA